MTDLALQLKDLPAKLVGEILGLLESAYASGAAAFGVTVFTSPKGAGMGEITVKSDEGNLSARVTALDSEGNPTTFDEMPTWQSSDEAVATVQPGEDGYTATFQIGDPGSTVITVTGVENSSGTPVEILSVGTITVTAGDAVVGSVEFSTGAPASEGGGTPAGAGTMTTENAPTTEGAPPPPPGTGG